MRTKIYYLLISLYGSINFVIGASIVAHYVLSPEVFADAVSDVVIGGIMVLIGVVSAIILFSRRSLKRARKTLNMVSSLILSLLLIPALMVLVVADFLVSDSVSPAYCYETRPSVQSDSGTAYVCDIRTINLDMLNNPDVPFIKDFTQGRSSTIFLASTLSFVVAATIGTMVTVRTIRAARVAQK